MLLSPELLQIGSTATEYLAQSRTMFLRASTPKDIYLYYKDTSRTGQVNAIIASSVSSILSVY